MAEEEVRRKEMERLQNIKNKEQEMMMRQQTEMKSMANVDLKYLSSTESRPGETHGFGFGNVRTGQVSSKKMAFLTRASSVGAEERAGLNPDVVIGRSASARASPMPILQAAPPSTMEPLKPALKADTDVGQQGK